MFIAKDCFLTGLEQVCTRIKLPLFHSCLFCAIYRRQFSPNCPFLSHTFLAIIIVFIILFIATLTWFFEGSGREDESKTWRKLGRSWKAAAGQGLGDYDDDYDDDDYDDDDNGDDQENSGGDMMLVMVMVICWCWRYYWWVGVRFLWYVPPYLESKRQPLATWWQFSLSFARKRWQICIMYVCVTKIA